MGQVVSNLMSNAFKRAAGSRVDVTLVRDADDAVLRVEDRDRESYPIRLVGSSTASSARLHATSPDLAWVST